MFLPIFVSLFLQDSPSPSPELKPVEKRVVVTGARHETDILDVASAVTVITAEDIRRSNARTIVDVLQARPGLAVTMNSSTPQDSVVDARGFNNGGGNGQRTLVLIDGRKVNTVTGTSVDWAAIPLHNVERIEIVRGPAASLYGDGAVACVVNVITKRAGRKPETRISGEGGSFRSHHETLVSSLPSGPASFSIAGSQWSSNGYRDNSAFDGFDASALVEYDAGQARAWFKYTGHADNRERPGTLTEAEIDQVGRDGSVTLGDDGVVESHAADLGLDWELLGGTLTPLLTWTTDRTEAVTSFAGGSIDGEGGSDIAGLALKYVRPLGIATLVAGADASFESADSSSFSNFPDPMFPFVEEQEAGFDRRLLGAYARLELPVVESVVISGSLRYDTTDIEFERETTDIDAGGALSVLEGDSDFSHWGPHLGTVWHVTPEQSVYASWGRTFRNPNRDELVGFLPTATNLKPERASVYEIGTRGKAAAWLSGSVSLFWMEVRDEIFFRPPAVGEDIFFTGNFGANENFPRIRHRGLEIEGSSSPLEGLELFATYTFQKTHVVHGPFEGSDLPITPRHSGSIGARYRVIEGMSLQLSLRVIGDRWLINDLSNEVEPLDEAEILDLKWSYRWERMTFFADVNNLIGTESYDNGGIGADGSGIWGNREAYNPAPERAFTAGFAVEF